MPCLLEGAFFVLFLVRTKGAGSLRSTCVSKSIPKSVSDSKGKRKEVRATPEKDGGKQGLRRKNEPVGGKSPSGAEKIGRGGWREARATPEKSACGRKNPARGGKN